MPHLKNQSWLVIPTANVPTLLVVCETVDGLSKVTVSYIRNLWECVERIHYQEDWTVQEANNSQVCYHNPSPPELGQNNRIPSRLI